jgi:predicted nucleic-acid-binding Zn-ribbon protein
MIKCVKCGTDYPSKYYFMTDALCLECFEKLNEDEKKTILAEVESISAEKASKRTIDGHPLRCPVCAQDRFWKRQTLMNTRGLTFLGVEWANKQAVNFVCDSCGYVMWFLRNDAEE